MFKIIKIFIFWRLGLLLVTYLGSLVLPLQANGGLGAPTLTKPFNYWLSWAQWDGGHYFNISQLGYFGPNEYAFFPLYPLLVKLTSFLFFGNHLIAGLLISNISFLAFLCVFYKLVKNKFNNDVALISLITVIIFPTAYFGVAMYSEGLFLLLAVLTFLMLEKKNFFLASVFVSLTSLTRFAGIFLVIPLAWYCIESIHFNIKKINLNLLAIPLSMVGFVGYCTYLWLRFNDPLYFFTVQSTWHRSLTNPITTIYSYLTTNITTKPFNDYLDIIATISFLVITVIRFRKIHPSWSLYSLLVIIVPASSGTLTSMPRYVLSAVPTFVLIGYYLKDKKVFRLLLWVIFLILQVKLAVMFVNGYWTA